MTQILQGIEKRAFTAIGASELSRTEGFVAIEEPLKVLVDGQAVAVLMRTPGKEKELAVGFCVSEGIIPRFDDIVLVHHCGSESVGEEPAGNPGESRNVVRITTLNHQAERRDPRLDVLRLVRTGCGRADPGELAVTLEPLAAGPRVARSVIASLSHVVIERQTTYRQAGGMHAVAIFDAAGNLISLGEDIGRHNAIDKAAGHCLMRRIPLDDKILYSSGRASYEMVVKTVRLGLSVMVSRSAATTLAIDLAERLNCTLIGYARGDSMTIYTHPERVMA